MSRVNTEITRIGLAVGFTLLLCACGGSSDTADATSLPDAHKLFSWTTQEKIAGFKASEKIYASKPFHHGNSVSELKTSAQPLTISYGYKGKASGVDDYMQHQQATALLIIKNGQIVLERYAQGNTPGTQWDSKSAGKSVVSTLVGAALKDGSISNLDDPVKKYIPELAGTGYDAATVRHLLQMSSGVKYNEDYTDEKSDIAYIIRECLAERRAGCILSRMASLPSVAAPGTVWNYSTGEAFLTGLVVQRATKKNLADYLQEKIWQPYGMESDGAWWLESDGGVAFGGGGFNATLRDWGRFGLYVMNNGVLPDGTATLPPNWMSDATTWTAISTPPGAPFGLYGYMWWNNPVDPTVNNPQPVTSPNSDWTFFALGVYGQLIAINQKEKLVMVQWSTWDTPKGVADNNPNEVATFFNAVSTALH